MTSSPNPPPIPDAPNKPPWVKAYAEYEGRFVRLGAVRQLAAICICEERDFSRTRDWVVGLGPEGVAPHQHNCPGWPIIGALVIFRTDDRAEALAEYHRQAELLRHRDALAGEGAHDDLQP